MSVNGTERDVLELVGHWAAAEGAGDAVALDGLLAADFVAVGPRGFVLEKEQWLARYRTDALRNTAFRFEHPQVRDYGDTAVVVGTQIQEATFQGNDAGGRFRVTLVAVRHGERWLVAGAHLSPAAEAGAAAAAGTGSGGGGNGRDAG
ncbi:nuclear transport factor 2 family protein [Streptosporangium sp. NPDC051023]|uniref:nuclear transport factor 2 family protein n=1 Tax=Streptosporangium sp. NPDC051023 TaxID=3155410 RepID=UPI00344BF5EE